MPDPFAPLSDAAIQLIHEQTLDLLSRWGVSFADENVLAFFKKLDLPVEGARVKFTRSVIEEAIENAPDVFEMTGRNPARAFSVGKGCPPAFGPGAGMAAVSDGSGKSREATFADAEKFWKLAHTSDYCSVAAAGLLYPTDLSADSALHKQILTALSLSDKPFFGLTQNEILAADSIAMAGIAAERHDNVCMGIVNSLSPLAWDGKMLGSMRVFAKERQPLIVAACAMAGSTAHVTLTGTLVSTNAEILAGLVYMQLLSPGTPVVYGNTSGISDMASLSLSIGSPETNIMAAAAAQMAHFYNIPCRMGGGLTDSAYLDMQAGVESGMSLLHTLCGRADFVLQALGVMNSFLSLCFEKWIIDEEILDRSMRLLRGFEKPAAGPADEIIEAMREPEGFLGHESTMGFRNEFWLPRVCARGATAGSITEQAAALVRKRLETYECPPLPKDTAAALARFL